MLNEVLYCQRKPISLLSRLKYIGNSSQGNEQFYYFRELRIFDRIINHEEYVFMSRPDRVASGEIVDDRVSFHEIVNTVYDEANMAIKQIIDDLLVEVLVSPGSNAISLIECMALLCRNGKPRFDNRCFQKIDEKVYLH